MVNPTETSTSNDDADLDTPIYGAGPIGQVVNLTERQASHALASGYLDADKFGKKWRSTKRRLLKLPSGARGAA
jgi:hypothetical protein